GCRSSTAAFPPPRASTGGRDMTTYSKIWLICSISALSNGFAKSDRTSTSWTPSIGSEGLADERTGGVSARFIVVNHQDHRRIRQKRCGLEKLREFRPVHA